MQEKPEYKKLYNNTYGDTGVEGTYNIGGTEYVMYNGQLMTSEDFNKKYGGATSKGKQYTAITQSQLKSGKSNFFKNFDDKYQDGIGGQCGKFVNDYLQTVGLGRYYDDNLDTKLNSVNSQIPTIGSIAVFDYGHKSSDGINHGHVGIVTDILPDGRIQILDSNFKGDEKIMERLIDPADVSLKGFFDPTISYGGGTSQSGATLTNNSSSSTSNTNSNVVVAGGLTEAGIEQEAKNMIDGKKTYSEIKAAYGDEALNKIELKMLDLANSGYEPSTKITDPTRLQTAENNALKQYESMIEDAKQVANFVDQMETAWSLIDTDKSAAEQLLITTYNKITDPKSIVRESEFNRTAEGQSLMNEFWGKLGKLATGGAGITKSELSKYINVARELGKNANAKIEQEANRMKVVIDKYGYSPEYILGYDMADKLYKYPEEERGTNIPSQGGMNGGTVNIGGNTWNASWGN